MRRSPLARVSAKRSAQATAYAKAKEEAWLRDRGQCQAARIWPEIACGGKLDPHHVKPVGLYPELRCDPDNLRVVCRRHHDHAHHVDPARARQLGLLA